MAIIINGSEIAVPEDVRVSLLDLLRMQTGLTGTKPGCNQGACGACTVLVDGRRVLSCLTLAAQMDGRSVVTIEGIGTPDEPHPLQRAFIECDGLQCGYCTPGQICAAIAMLDEMRAGLPSYVTEELSAPAPLSREEIRERMSGNLCRCGAHNGIVDAILHVATEQTGS